MKNLVLVPLVLVALPMLAQTAAPASPAWSPSKALGVYVFPKHGQNADQQLKDESECYAAAKDQSGIDPQAPPPTGPSSEKQQAAAQQAAANAPKVRGARVATAARGAAGGAAIGAIAGDAGKGAAIGATAGTMRGGAKQRRANAAAKEQAAAKTTQQQQKATAQAQTAHKEGLDSFQRAFGACLDARGYSVK